MIQRPFFFFGGIILLLLGCDCDEHELLINEVPSLFLVETIQEEIPYLRIQLNKKIDATSVILDESIFLKTNSEIYSGSIFYDSAAILIPICDLMCADSDTCQYEVILDGIKTTDGQSLDGDLDGTDGGQFIDTFQITPVDAMNFYIDTFFITCKEELVEIDPGLFQSYNWSTGETARIISVNQPGVYSVQLSDDNNCLMTATANVIPKPIEGLYAGIDTMVCKGDTIMLSANNGCGYTWQAFPPTHFSDSKSQNPIVILSNTTTFQVRSSNINGQETIDEVVISVDNFTPDAGKDLDICKGDTITLNPSGGVDYTWTPSTGLSNPLIANPAVTAFKSINYTLTAINANGCIGVDEVAVNVDPRNFFVKSFDNFSDSLGNRISICFSEPLDTSTLRINENLLFSFSPDDINLVTPYTSSGKCLELYFCHKACPTGSCSLLITIFTEDNFGLSTPIISSTEGNILEGNFSNRHEFPLIQIKPCN